MQSQTSTVKVKSVHKVGKEDVFNLEAKKTHCFAVQGGIVVHNCDAIRYYCKTILPGWRVGDEPGEDQ